MRLRGVHSEMKSEDKKKNRKIWLLYGLMCICAAGVIVFGIGLGLELHTNMQARSYYEDIASDIVRRPYDPANRPHPQPPSNNNNEVTDEQPNDVVGSEPEPEPAWEPFVDFNALGERFPGIVGWILKEDSKIDYPIMQWRDNYYFLGRLPDGTMHRNGSIFLDYRNNPDFTDRNTIIYGHESRTEDMFGSLKNYRRQEYYDRSPVIYIFTPERDYQLVLFAGYLLDSGYEVPPLTFRDDEAFERHIADIKRRSFFQSDVEVTANDRIVSLATCAYDFTNARFIIVGKLVEF